MTEGAPLFDDAFQAQLQDLFRWRRDVRHFLPTPIPPATLDALLQTAALAPSVGLSQPWRFVTVDDPGRRAAIRANFQACNAEALSRQEGDRAGLYARLKLAGLEEAPCHLAVFAEPDPAQGHGLGRRTMPETTAYSAVMGDPHAVAGGAGGGAGAGVGVDSGRGRGGAGAGCAGRVGVCGVSVLGSARRGA